MCWSCYKCCSQATLSTEFCVCMYVIKCPVHGVQHIGTHD